GHPSVRTDAGRQLRPLRFVRGADSAKATRGSAHCMLLSRLSGATRTRRTADPQRDVQLETWDYQVTVAMPKEHDTALPCAWACRDSRRVFLEDQALAAARNLAVEMQ